LVWKTYANIAKPSEVYYKQKWNKQIKMNSKHYISDVILCANTVVKVQKEKYININMGCIYNGVCSSLPFSCDKRSQILLLWCPLWYFIQ
jgi:hypothetical protein